MKGSGCGDAGECVAKLQDMEPSKLRRWASERAAGSPACTLYETLPYTSLPEPPERRVEALLSFVIRTVKGGTQVNVDTGISPVEVAVFQSSRSGARLVPATPRSFGQSQSFMIGHGSNHETIDRLGRRS